ncbi:alpha/beta fold hydrolase [Saccharopolyspora rosea]|uniref:Alpha/beta fold hydrolase n=1 Tax=Saccharopolyspora rosea TaxID=524884 RepID=A0ABW3FX07_9PSEU|nr:alpha/beta hydrolase [Saccharopolyspora rosea]
MPEIALNDIEVHYDESGSGPAVVFVHGLAEDHRSWHQRHELADRRTYAYDLRGHGRTSLGEADGTLAQLRDDLIAFLESVSGAATCVGFSLGGTVVLAAAAARPDLVPAAVLMATSAVVGRAATEFYRSRIEQVRSGDGDAVLASLRADTAAMLASSDVDVDEVVARRSEAIGDGRGYANAASAMAAVREQPLTPLLGAITAPVTVIGAADDRFCPRKAADILLDGLPRATYREIPRAGHLMNVDNPVAVTAELRACLPT